MLEVLGAMNPQEIANTLWAFATLGRQPSEVLLVRLTAQALTVLEDSNSQQIASTLWALATLGRQPNEALLVGLAARALTVLEDFNSQGIAITLWALATLGRQPSEALMVGLTARALAVLDFTSQGTANTLWAFATLSLPPETQVLQVFQERVLVVSKDFNPQGISNTLWALAKLGQVPNDKVLVVLSARAVEILHYFNPKDITNMLWTLAKMGHQPEVQLMRAFETRALVVLDDFNCQNIANTLWALAKLGHQPEAKMLRAFETRVMAVLSEFNCQNIANMLWAACFISIFHPDEASCLVHTLEPRITALADSFQLDMQQRQLHLFFISLELDEELRGGVPASILALTKMLGPMCHSAFGNTVPTLVGTSSKSQLEVSRALIGMGLSVQDEARCLKSGHSLDMFVHDTPVLHFSGRESAIAHTGAWVVEFDGPTHFLTCRAPTGSTLIKQHHLNLLGHLLGYSLVSIPYWEWHNVGVGSTERQQYLRHKLESATRTLPVRPLRSPLGW